LRTALAAAEARAIAAEREVTQSRAVISASYDMIRHLRLEIAKLRREQFGPSSERRARLIEHLEMQLEGLETDIKADRAKAEAEAPRSLVDAFERRRPSRKPFPEHLPRECGVVEAPAACTCCGSGRIVKLGEDITETLEIIPRQWKVIQTVREKFTCRDCERNSQPPAPFHPTPRGWAGPNLLATILFEKFGQHLPLNRQVERFAKVGVEIRLSTLADQVGACAGALFKAHVMAAKRLHADDTTVPLLAKGGTTTTARL
jgi:transposase